MKKNQLIVFALFFTFSLLAQKKSNFGPLMKIDRGYLPYIVGEDKNDLFAVKYKKETIIVETFDKRRLRSAGVKEVEIEELRGVREELEKLAYINDEIVYFTSLFDYRENEFDLIAQKLNPKNGKVTDKKVLFEKSTDRDRHKGEYEIYFSKNRKRILVRTYTYYKETDKTIENLILFNDKLELITEREYTETGKTVNLSSSLLVDDEGSIYFVQNGEVVILDAFNKFEEWRETLPLDNLELGAEYRRPVITLNKDLDLVISAYYVTTDIEDLDKDDVNKARKDRKEGDTQMEGVVFFKVNTLDKELEVVKHTVFGKDFIDLFKTKKDLKKNYEAEIEDEFNINSVYSLDNGESFMVGEIFKKYTSTDQNGNVTGEQEHYLDMILIHFGSDGQVLWKDRLPKEQVYYWSQFLMGFNFNSAGTNFFIIPPGLNAYFHEKVIRTEDKVYIVYNDLAENRAGNSYVHDLKTFKKFKKGVPIVQTIDLKRGSRKGAITNSLVKPKFWLKPGGMYHSKIDGDVYYFITYKRKMHMAKTTFK
tara:strand:+ start:2598 stop:4205 length:1608 start_codon:yes stop_codon:yes gene_type:complete